MTGSLVALLGAAIRQHGASDLAAWASERAVSLGLDAPDLATADGLRACYWLAYGLHVESIDAAPASEAACEILPTSELLIALRVLANVARVSMEAADV